ncbi:hypothetical protein CPLU01_14673 [Colletotrichum plurivorum]|uniref:Uncharacterized protein n=1 Tax=Colletotrichum plurivorum TaxID=2175906 RepID=A0A8H6JIP4_9PEZI|nr:hypothetical protein CPLU01_14673 [Colletotrichum plurivorum]
MPPCTDGLLDGVEESLQATERARQVRLPCSKSGNGCFYVGVWHDGCGTAGAEASPEGEMLLVTPNSDRFSDLRAAHDMTDEDTPSLRLLRRIFPGIYGEFVRKARGRRTGSDQRLSNPPGSRSRSSPAEAQKDTDPGATRAGAAASSMASEVPVRADRPASAAVRGSERDDVLRVRPQRLRLQTAARELDGNSAGLCGQG